MLLMTNTKNIFRAILQSIVCDRYADAQSAHRAIDEAFEAGRISQLEARQLEARVK